MTWAQALHRSTERDYTKDKLRISQTIWIPSHLSLKRNAQAMSLMTWVFSLHSIKRVTKMSTLWNSEYNHQLSYLVILCFLKGSKNRNDFMKTSFLPQQQCNFCLDFCPIIYLVLYNRAEILTIISLLFWEKHKIISIFTDLWQSKCIHFAQTFRKVLSLNQLQLDAIRFLLTAIFQILIAQPLYIRT